MKPLYYCAICATSVRSGRAILCAHCREKFPDDEPWMELLKREEHAARERDRYLRDEGIQVLSLSGLTEAEMSRATKLA